MINGEDMRILYLISTITFLSFGAIGHASEGSKCAPLLDHKVRTLNDTNSVHLCKTYKNQVLLVVNTASKCGYTPQYEGLEKLYQNLKDQGFAVLGFPSNDFAGQEPGNEAQVQNFCRLTYGVEFPMFEKTVVKEGGASPFYAALAEKAGTAPQWNFHKYLIGRDGNLIASFPSRITPESAELNTAIQKALAAK